MCWNSSWAVSNPKRDAVKVLHSVCQQIWKLQYWPQDWKMSIFFPIPMKDKECSNYHTIALISHARKIMLKIPQARLQQYVNCELSDVQAGFRKGRGPEIKLQTSTESSKKQENSRKTSTSALLIHQSLWLCGSPQTLENSQRDGNTRPHDLPSEKSICRLRSNS